MKYTVIYIAILLFAILETIQTYDNSNIYKKWTAYKAKYKLEFTRREDSYRRRVFERNLRFIEEHNRKNLSFELGMNMFGHWTHGEYLHFLHKGNQGNVITPKSYKYVASRATDEVDWRLRGCVTRVKKQGNCESCWAFTATGVLEGQHAIRYGSLVELSEQDLVDCSTEYGNYGCYTGRPDLAFRYVSDNGINSEKDYPYKGKQEKCKHDNEKNILKVSAHGILPSGNENYLTNTIKDFGPVSVSIDAHEPEFKYFKKGVYISDTCSSLRINHGVLAVGYGSSWRIDYYIIKNSWGTEWADNGYILMARNKNNMCGIATNAMIAAIYR